MNWPEDFINKIICGDSLEMMKEMPNGSVDMAITSPPYWGLRDYGIEQVFGGNKDCEHDFNLIHRRRGDKSGAHGPSSIIGAKKAQHEVRKGEATKTCNKCGAWKGQLGLEPTPEIYIEHLTEIFNEVKRVLKKEGTFFLNMGDTYWSAKGSCFNPGGGKDSIETKRREIYPLNRGNKSDVPNLPPKCLTMIPERLSWSLIQNGWILRNKIIWEKPNCMPASVKDRYTNKWEYVFYFVKSQRNYFDLDAVREPHSFNRWSLSNPIKSKFAKQAAPGQTKHSWQRKGHAGYYDAEGNLIVHPLGKNPGDIWTIPTRPCPVPGIHFATFPEKLCKKAIIPGSPEEVCKKCGKARERITESILGYGAVKSKTRATKDKAHNMAELAERRQYYRSLGYESPPAPKTIGWTSCNCNAGFEGGIVLDPFCGVGTALYVAKQLRRRFVGIDIKKEYCEKSKIRLAQGVL